MASRKKKWSTSSDTTSAASGAQHIIQGSARLGLLDDMDVGAGPFTVSDVPEPADVEAALQQRRLVLPAASTDLVWPADDVDVVTTQKPPITVDPLFPVDFERHQNLTAASRQSLRFFAAPHCRVVRKAEHFGMAEAGQKLRCRRQTQLTFNPLNPNQQYESDAALLASADQIELQRKRHFTMASASGSQSVADSPDPFLTTTSSSSDPLLSDILSDSPSKKSSTSSAAARQQLLVGLCATQPVQRPIECRQLPGAPGERRTRRLLVKVLDLKLQPSVEPVFGSLALYDAKSKRKAFLKVTENFYFDVNEDRLRRLLPESAAARPGGARQASILLPDSLSHLFLVVRLEKVLQGMDSAEAADAYLNLSSSTDEARLAHQAEEACARLGAYRMPLGLAVFELSRLLSSAAQNAEKVMSASTTGPSRTCSPTPSTATLSGILGLGVGESDSIRSADGTFAILPSSGNPAGPRTAAETISSTVSAFRRIGSATSAGIPEQVKRFFSALPQDDATSASGATSGAGHSAEELLDLLVDQKVLVSFNNFFRVDGDRWADEELLFKLLAEIRSSAASSGASGAEGSSRLLRSVPFSMTVQFGAASTTQCPEDIAMRLSPEMLRMAPFETTPGAELTKELLEIPARRRFVVNAHYRSVFSMSFANYLACPNLLSPLAQSTSMHFSNLLYVYPRSVSFSSTRQGSCAARNLLCRVELLDGRGRPVESSLLGRSTGADAASTLSTAVIYHNRSPNWTDEWKVRIPLELVDGHHLLFTFYHVSCKVQDSGQTAEQAVGWAWLPLLRGGRLVPSGAISLPVSLDPLPAGYGFLPSDVALPHLRWLDAHRPVFQLHLQAVTSLHPQDEALDRFFDGLGSLFDLDKCKQPVDETTMCNCTKALLKAEPDALVAFLYPLFDALLVLMTQTPQSLDKLPLVCWETMGQLAKLCSSLICMDESENLLAAYVLHFSVTRKRWATWNPSLGDVSSEKRQRSGSPSLYEIIEDVERTASEMKTSWSEHAASSHGGRSLFDAPAHERLVALWLHGSQAGKELAAQNADFFLQLILKSVAEEKRTKTSDNFARQLYRLFELLTNDLLVKIGTGDAASAAELSLALANSLRDALSLIDRTTVLRLVALHQKALVNRIRLLNGSGATASLLMRIKVDFLRVVSAHEHFALINLPWINDSTSAPSLEWKQRHFLIALILADLKTALQPQSSRSLRQRTVALVGSLISSHEIDARLVSAKTMQNLHSLSALYTPLLDTVISSVDHLEDLKNVEPDVLRELLASFLWILRSIDRTVLRSWLDKVVSVNQEKLHRILRLSVTLFQYEPTLCDDVGLWRREQSTETTAVILDTLDHVVGKENDILATLLHILGAQQSCKSVEGALRAVRKLTIRLEQQDVEDRRLGLGELSLQLLRLAGSARPAVGANSAATLYLLLRESYGNSNSSFQRVRQQLTMALARLVAQPGALNSDANLRSRLRAVLSYAEADDVSGKFFDQTRALVFNLHMILVNTAKMRVAVGDDDVDLRLDVMSSLASSYKNNPALRLTWLSTMADTHSSRRFWAEAAQCHLHAAALIAEHLKDCPDIRGAIDFEALSANVLDEESAIEENAADRESSVAEDDDLDENLTEEGLIRAVETAADFLERAQMFEHIPLIYRVILPILTRRQDWAQLSIAHEKCSTLLAQVAPTVEVLEHLADAWTSPLSGHDKRCFGSYFRVGFYGQAFGCLDGNEYIYKEQAWTKLSEMADRLESFYSRRVGSVEIVKDSNAVLRTSSSQTRACLQVTYVEPWLEDWERKARPAVIDRSTRLRRFAFATPFTRDGRSHGSIEEQHKRRVILTTEHSFPYILTRVRVIARETHVLAPIEAAIEDVVKKTMELASATRIRPADSKMLQMVLQGCIGTQVNQGPVQAARVFLGERARDRQGKLADPLANKLRLCFKDFLKKCADALALNQQLITEEQRTYQMELHRNYVDMTRAMAPLVATTVFPSPSAPPPSSSQKTTTIENGAIPNTTTTTTAV